MVFLLPAGAIAYYIYMPKSNVNIGIAVLLAAAGIALNKPLQALRVKYRHDVEYDEFGRSKSKGNYEYLSKAERDKMDLQKTLDMERIMDSSALKKMTKKGAKDPEKEMNSLVGLVPVKNKMREMVARMKFEKGQGKKYVRKTYGILWFARNRKDHSCKDNNRIFIQIRIYKRK